MNASKQMGCTPVVSLIVPTYCEAANLEELVTRIDAALARLYVYELIVVDDDSPDESAKICEAMGAKLPVRFEVRKGMRGLSSAVVHGMQQATGEVLVVMDADLSHPPESLPRLIETLLLTNADLVIGSRYCSESRVSNAWSKPRRLLSRVATWLALPLTRAHDPMTGFFALKRSTFLNATRLNPVGFKIGLELIVRCRCRRLVEVPIDFEARKSGTSKLTWSVQRQYLLQLIRLYVFCTAAAIKRFVRLM